MIKAARRQSETQEASYNSEQQEPLKCESVFMQHNGNPFEMGRLWGELQTHMRMQTDILLDIKDSIEGLPSRLSTAIGSGQTPSPQGRILPELSELIRALYPPLILLAALVGKSALPGETGLLRAVLEAVVGGAGS